MRALRIHEAATDEAAEAQRGTKKNVPGLAQSSSMLSMQPSIC